MNRVQSGYGRVRHGRWGLRSLVRTGAGDFSWGKDVGMGSDFDQIRPGNEIGFAPVNMNKAAEVSEAGGEIGGDEVR